MLSNDKDLFMIQLLLPYLPSSQLPYLACLLVLLVYNDVFVGVGVDMDLSIPRGGHTHIAPVVHPHQGQLKGERLGLEI